MSAKDALGDRIKRYEAHETSRAALHGVPLVARLDGRAFHTLTRGLDRPFSYRFHDAMVATTEALLCETDARIAYTQSDEISLVLLPREQKSELPFGGSLFKLTSVLSGLASSVFTVEWANRLSIGGKLRPHFDCRVFAVPTLEEAANALLWRERDAKCPIHPRRRAGRWPLRLISRGRGMADLWPFLG